RNRCAAKKCDELAPSHCLPRGSRQGICRLKLAHFKMPGMRSADVRFGSEADMCAAKRDVRFTPNSDRESEIPQKAMSALAPKADMCSAIVHVRFGPIADSCTATNSISIRSARQRGSRRTPPMLSPNRFLSALRAEGKKAKPRAHFAAGGATAAD